MNQTVLGVKVPVMIQGKKMIKVGIRVLATETVKAEFEMYCKGRSQRIME